MSQSTVLVFSGKAVISAENLQNLTIVVYGLAAAVFAASLNTYSASYSFHFHGFF